MIDVRPDGAWAAAISVVALLVLAISLAVRGGRMTTRRMAVSPFGPRRVRHAPPGRARGPGLRVWAIGRFAPAPLGAALGWVLAGPMGAVVGGGAGAAVPLIRACRESRTRAEGLERDLADLASTTGLALRSGLSVSQALEYAGSELPFPTRELFERFLEQRRLGVPFEPALSEFGAALGTDDAQLFVLVMGVHARSGGDLAGALDEVATTIRHRVAVRRELRAASTQGRVSGAILGALPIAFFLVLAATSHRQLGPVYRSAPGVAMVGGGLAMEGLAYVWIRRLLRLEI